MFYIKQLVPETFLPISDQFLAVHNDCTRVALAKINNFGNDKPLLLYSQHFFKDEFPLFVNSLVFLFLNEDVVSYFDFGSFWRNKYLRIRSL